PRVDAFERDFAAYCQSRYAVGLSSGTDALLIALMVLGIGPGDEVIVPAYSFFATAGVVDRLGATPVFVDIDLADYNIDPKLIESRITSNTKAIMPVHLYGQCAAMDEINRIDALQAAILHIKLPHLDGWSEGRRRNAAIYAELFADTNLGDRVVLPRELPKRRHIYNQYIVRFTDSAARDRVLNHLKSAGIGC